MWIETLDNGKFKYFERYIDPYSEKQKRVSITMLSDSKQAQKKATKLLAEKIDKKLMELGNKANDITFLDFFNEWWKFYKKELKNSSISSLKVQVNRINKTFDKDYKLKNIDVKFIQKYINELDASRGDLQRVKSLLNLAFDHAVSMEYTQDNPARKAKLPKKVITIDDLTKTQTKYLERDELRALLDELYRLPSTYHLGLLAEFMSLNGCRMGEAIALRPENYHREKALIDIHGTLDGVSSGYTKGIKTSPKTLSSFRTVSLSQREIEILDEMIGITEYDKSVRADYNDLGYIFVSKRGIPIQINSFNLAIKKANTRLEHPINKNLSSHIFRHTLISLLAEKGIPEKAIMDRVGHKEGSKTTREIYTHVTKKMKSNIVDVLNDL